MLSIIIVLTICRINYSQDNSFLPLALNNVFVYDITYVSSPPTPPIRLKMKIDNDTVINGKTYYKIYFPPYSSTSNPVWARVDSITGTLLAYNNTSTCPYYLYHIQLDSLMSRLNDSSNICSAVPRVKCTDTSYSYIFSQHRQMKVFSGVQFIGAYTNNIMRKYHKNFGLTEYQQTLFAHNLYKETWVMLGCVINSVLYGDTSMPVGINNNLGKINENFYLHQNYPNPFNPLTSIKYDLPKSVIVKIILYDLLGREIEILVNEFKDAGNYHINWDASNFASGVYFYKIIAGDYTESKKMLLIK